MSKFDFEEKEFQDRQQRVRSAMNDAGIDLLLVIDPINIYYLTGCRGGGGEAELQVLFFPLEPGPVTFLSRLQDAYEHTGLILVDEVRGFGGREPEDPMNQVKTILEEKGYLNLRVGLEVPDYYLNAHDYLRLKEILGKSLVTEATHLIEELRFVKSPAEITYVREAARIADEAMKTCVENAAVGKTQTEIGAEMQYTLWALGSETPARPMNFAIGDKTALPNFKVASISHHSLTAGVTAGEEQGIRIVEGIKSSEMMHIDYGVSFKKYTAIIGRVLCAGQPSQRQREIYQVARDAADAAIAAIKPGVAATVPHQVANKVIAEAGMDRHRLHMTGFSIAPGFPPKEAESLHLDSDSPYTLESGMVLCVQPGVFVYEEGLGARVTDTVLVTDSGTEILTRFGRDLIIF